MSAPGSLDGNKQLYWTGDEPILRIRFTGNPVNARHVRASQQPFSELIAVEGRSHVLPVGVCTVAIVE